MIQRVLWMGNRDIDSIIFLHTVAGALICPPVYAISYWMDNVEKESPFYVKVTEGVVAMSSVLIVGGLGGMMGGAFIGLTAPFSYLVLGGYGYYKHANGDFDNTALYKTINARWTAYQRKRMGNRE